MTTFIYALKCPTTGEIRYVGKTNNPKGRVRRHLFDARKGESCHRAAWVRALLANGLVPDLEILDEVCVAEWQQWEVAYIEFFREQGFDLTNGTRGGDGVHSPTEETIEKHRVIMRGPKNPFRGKKQSSETIARRVARTTGMKRTPEQCARISAGKKGSVPWNKGKKNYVG